jgi:transposase
VQVVYERCCGLDVHKRTITACMLKWLGGQGQKEIRQFGTMTKDLLELSDWLIAEDCTHVAMESTGVYWKPVYNILEGHFELLVVNAQHLKAVLVARPTCAMPSGSRSCSRMDCCAVVLCPQRMSVNCVT